MTDTQEAGTVQPLDARLTEAQEKWREVRMNQELWEMLGEAAGAIKELAALRAARDNVLRLCDNPTELNTIALRNSLQPFLNEWLQKANRESQKHGFAESYRYDSNDRWLLDHVLIFILAEIRALLPLDEESKK